MTTTRTRILIIGAALAAMSADALRGIVRGVIVSDVLAGVPQLAIEASPAASAVIRGVRQSLRDWASVVCVTETQGNARPPIGLEASPVPDT